MSSGRFSSQAIAELDRIVSHYPDPKSAVLPALWLAQREYGGWLTPDAIREVSDRLDRPTIEVEGVATFYTMYNHVVRGRHHLEVCTCLTCGCQGAYDVYHALGERLGVGPNEVTPDGEFSYGEAECLNWCAEPTVIQVGEKYYVGVTPASVGALLDELRKRSDLTPTSLAADIVNSIAGPAAGSEASNG